jgi:SAM-dependent methyltransferase
MHLLPKRTMEAYVTARVSEGRVVDLGCGEGAALLKLPPAYTPFGIEISSALAAHADRLFRGRGGYAINASSLSGLRQFPDGFFDAATLRSYLEHEQHPMPVLRELRRVLAPRGFAVVKVPNFGSLNRIVTGRRWCGFRYPDHLNYFTPRTLTAMAARCGFSTRFGVTGWLPTSDNMWAVLSKAA